MEVTAALSVADSVRPSVRPSVDVYFATRETAPPNYYFLADAVFLAEVFDLEAAAAVFFGLGAFGFLVGGLAVFLAFGAAAAAAPPFALAGVEAFLAAAAAAAAAGFLLAAAAFLSLVAAFDLDGDAADEAAFFALPAPAVSFFLDLAVAEAAAEEAEEDPLPPPEAEAPAEPVLLDAVDLFFLPPAEDFDLSSLKEPDAP